MPAQQKKKLVNLVPRSNFEDTTAGRVLKWTLSTFRMLVIFVELVVIAGFIARFWLDVVHSDLNDEIKQKTQLIESYSSLETNFKKAQTKLLLFKTIDEQENRNSDLIAALTTKIPNGANLSQFKRNASLMEISIESVSEQAVSQLISNLQASQDFTDMKLIRVQSQEGNPYVIYTLQKNIVVETDNSVVEDQENGNQI